MMKHYDELHTQHLLDITKIIQTCYTVDYFENVDVNVEIYNDMYNIELNIKTIYTDEIYTIKCGFGSGGFYIDHYEIQFNNLLEMLKNSCLR